MIKYDKNPIVLIILDGWGHKAEEQNNAIFKAKTPFFDHLWANYPHTLLNASETSVGLTEGTIGNSEIGHMTMGAGRIIDTELVRINKAIQNDELKNNHALNQLFTHVKKHQSTLHILGLLSPAGVHSHQTHLFGILSACKHAQISQVAIHAFTDGRDSPPKDAHKYLAELESVMARVGIGHIATTTGRYFAMDRDNNWQRTEVAQKALFESQGKIFKNQKPSEVLKTLADEGIMDEYLEPLVFLDERGKSYPIAKNDGVLFFNFRTDRPRQLSFKIAEQAKTKNLFFVTMTEYSPELDALVAFPPQKPDTTLSAEISQAGLTQSHIAETEKYAHVTFFFNGGKQDTHPGEQHFLIESRKDVKTHDEAPEMRAKEIADKAIERINQGDNFIVLNFANADMVGHTANQPAIITAVETVDRELKRVVEKVLMTNGVAIITADHGNAETNVDEKTGELHTAHTLNPVPFILVSSPPKPITQNPKPTSSLADIAPTILQLMHLPKPKSMTGESLIQTYAN
jgi:2,3-bisphosphoglycerate-independent phosphoglycerate mutase